MDNVFLDLLYQKEFNNTGLFDRMRNKRKYKSFLKSLSKEPPSFEIMWQFAKFLRWVDIIYGFDENLNNDIDLAKKRNPYLIDSNTKEDVEITFTINCNERSKISFDLVKSEKFIRIDVMREKIPTSEDKTSSIRFRAEEEGFKFSEIDQLMICEINRILQDKMVKYTKLYWEKVR